MLKPDKHGNRWRLRYVDPVSGERVSQTFKEIGEARVVAAKLNLEQERTRNGNLAEERIPDRTFSALCDEWLQNRALQKRSQADDVAIINSRLRPEMDTTLLRAIGVDHADRYARKVLQECVFHVVVGTRSTGT
jgi:hypothetical protein